jgi:GTP cyclohydrolase I
MFHNLPRKGRDITMYSKTKTDPKLGREIHNHLFKLGIETPTTDSSELVSNQEKIEMVEHYMKKIMEVMNLDLTDDSLMDTPKRYAKMMVNEICYGLDWEAFPKCTVVENKMDAGMVIEKDIQVMSICEHHLISIDGMATVAYIPKDKVLGLSKINRIVDYFARRPQIQERLTNQIWHALNYILDTDNIAVYIDAIHYCVKSRGAQDQTSHTITNKLGGAFKADSATRAEFMSLCHN